MASNSESFQFLPRKLKTKPRTDALGTTITAVASSSGQSANVSSLGSSAVAPANSITKNPSTSTKTTYSDEDLATLLSLALSDHALNSDADLRRSIDQAEDGFIPLKGFLRNSRVLSGHPIPSEIHVARALRAFPQDPLELRLRVNSDPASGIYEIRRTDTLEIQGGWKRDAGDREIYVENIPPSYRTMPRLARFLASLLPSPIPSKIPVQAINVLSSTHDHPDRKRLPSASRGFALVTLADSSSCTFILEVWPWERDVSLIESSTTNAGEVNNDATRFGFRTLSRANWDARNEEYKAWRAALVADAIKISTSVNGSHRQLEENDRMKDGEDGEEYEEWWGVDTGDTPAYEEEEEESQADYPVDCVLFAQGLDAGTNRTALRHLFSEPLGGKCIDYVDYTKGTASCYVRLANARSASVLCDHFQNQGKAGGKIAVERLQGRKEAVYWENIPERVRKEAVARSLANAEAIVDEGGRKKRKRGKA